ncbi:MAG: DnaA/Hda family protein [Pseudomonadota bacterium]
MAADRSALQLPLALRGEDEATFELFVADPTFVHYLQQVAEGKIREWVWLQGPAGWGKTHLLSAVYREADRAAGYLDAAALLASGQDSLAQIDGYELVLLDNVECALVPGWEEAWFHRLNRWRDAGVQLVVASRQHPRNLQLGLPDLASRLKMMVEVSIAPLDTSGRAELLARRSAARGFDLPSAVVSYLLSREARSAVELVGMLDRLGRESLRAQRKLTVPFVRQVLGGD